MTWFAVGFVINSTSFILRDNEVITREENEELHELLVAYIDLLDNNGVEF